MITIMLCPFCDHDDVEVCETEPHRYAISCPNCEAIGPICRSIEKAIAKWNRPHGCDFKIDRLVREAKVGYGDTVQRSLL